MRARNGVFFSVAIVCALVFTGSARGDSVTSLNELKQQMLLYGKPAMIIAGADWCVYCREMAQELATSPTLQPLQRQFAILKIDVDTPIWPAAKKFLKIESTGVPVVLVFRADGERISSTAGKPKDMEEFLKSNLQDAGRVLSPQEARTLTQEVTKLQRHLKQDKLPLAIEIAARYQIETCYAQPAQAMLQAQQQIGELVTARLEEIEKALAANPEDLSQVMKLLALKSECSSSRDLLEKVEAAEKRCRAGQTPQDFFAHAEKLAEADRLNKEGQRKQAQTIYRELVEQHPDTPVARLATERLGGAAQVAGTAESTPMSKDDSSTAEKKAASYLRMGRQLLKGNPSSAKKYLQKAIDTAPNGEAAAEARELLK